jgi:protease II
VNVTINGIDYLILENEGYHKALADEITRVAKKDGIIFGTNAPCINDLRYNKCNRTIIAQDEKENKRLMELSRKGINGTLQTGYMTFEENDPQSSISVHKLDDYAFVIEKNSPFEEQ